MSVLGIKVFDRPLVFVDIETNGLDHVRGRVIEVAAIRVEHGVITQKFSSLVDPGTELPYFITNLTGITTNDVKQAPSFSQIADELRAVLDGAIFVAHNVRFDYSFLKQEFKRLNQPFLPKQLCTVKLSRVMYPYEKSHKLESLIKRHNFTYAKRHRAYDDAAVLWQFMQHVYNNFPPEQVAAAIALQIKQPAIPKNLKPDLVKNLPESPGVYIFEDEAGQPLYVGKSVNIKKRVISHFGRDHVESREFKIAQNIRHVRTEQTTGELGALLLESRLVKELQPVYNRRLRRLSKLSLVKQHIGSDGYALVSVDESSAIDPDESAAILAVYPRRGRAKDALNEMVRTFDLCPKLMGLEKASGPCFFYQLHKCRGACVGKESASSYNQRLLTAFDNQRIQVWPFKSAILLEESAESGATHGVVVDKWCVLGEVTQEPDCDPTLKVSERVFDLDTYKILQSFITHKLKKLVIQPLDQQQLSQLGM